MNKKVTKCIIMLLCTIFIWTGNMTTYAAETADPETSDLKPLELYQIDESYGDLDEAAMSISDSSSGTHYLVSIVRIGTHMEMIIAIRI